jgi:hypothetical protein
MKYLCLIYYEEQKLNALSTREWDALIDEASAYDEARLLRNFKCRGLIPGSRPASGRVGPPFCASRRSPGPGLAGDIPRGSDHDTGCDG